MCIFKIRLLSLTLLFLSFQACSAQGVDSNSNSNANPVSKPGAIKARQFNFPTDKYVMVAAHRAGGYVHGQPENSLSAIANALKLGVDIIEIDVRITLDQKLVVMHDKTLERTTNGSGKVSHTSLKDIKKLFLKDKNGAVTSEKVQTLEEVLSVIGNKAIVFIDKSEYVLEYVMPILKKTNAYQNALFMDFIEFVQAKSKYKDLLERSYFIPGMHDSNADLDSYYSGFKEGFSPRPTALAFWFKKEDNSKSFSLITKALADTIPVWINTTTLDQSAGHTDEASLLNPDNGWGWALNQGARIIFTDEPEALINYLKAKGLR
jgi:glycerophosphoryl diester phosphodiesterase